MMKIPSHTTGARTRADPKIYSFRQRRKRKKRTVEKYSKVVNYYHYNLMRKTSLVFKIELPLPHKSLRLGVEEKKEKLFRGSRESRPLPICERQREGPSFFYFIFFLFRVYGGERGRGVSKNRFRGVRNRNTIFTTNLPPVLPHRPTMTSSIPARL